MRDFFALMKIVFLMGDEQLRYQRTRESGPHFFTRMYAENICTPTRAAFMTGRLAIRSGMHVTKVTPPEGVGLPGDEVTIAELFSQAGYQTTHIGKWHLGDIKEAYPVNQGFDFASFPMHNRSRSAS